MRMLLCVFALLAAQPALARTQRAGWIEIGRSDYPRADYGPGGPRPLYYAPGSYVMYPAPGAHSYRYRNGVRVWYGVVPAFAPVLTTAALVAQGPPIAAPASPGPRVYRAANRVRVWYGQ